MGKKKATFTKRIKPLIENAINDGNVYVRDEYAAFNMVLKQSPSARAHLLYKECYSVAFGMEEFDDEYAYEHGIEFEVIINQENKLTYTIITPWKKGRKQKQLSLNKTADIWLQDQLEQIITLAKMGAYPRQKKDW